MQKESKFFRVSRCIWREKMERTARSSIQNRIVLAARIAVIAIFCIAWLDAKPSRSNTDEQAELPGNASGRCASAYFDAFNSGSAEKMQAFDEEYRSLSYLEQLSPDKRLKSYERLRGIFGRLTPIRVVLNLDLQLTLLADAANTDDALVIRFQLEEEPPRRLDYLKFSGIDHAQVPDQYVLYVADRAQPLDKALMEETVRTAARILREKYIDPEMGKAMADTMLANLSGGAYNEAKTTGRLADMLTEDAVALSRDEHVWIEAVNPLCRQSIYPENRPVEELRQENYHFRKVEILPGNIGYLKFDMIHDDQEALDIAADALAKVARCDALIFDLTDNIGGEWGNGRLILSYLFPRNTVLSRTYDRNGRLVDTDSTLAELRGERFGKDVPVYVLTSKRTGSAAEAFTFALQQSGRGTVVGQTTCGGGYRCDEVQINSHFFISVSTLKPVSAFTESSLQGVGVVPDIRVSEEKALEAALKDAKKRIHAPAR